MVAEILGGLLANSLAVLTDAAHLLSDLAGFLISIFALWLAKKEPTSRLSFGFHRAEILGALVSVVLIWILTGVLVYEASYRIMHPEDVDGKVMFIVASAGLGVNLLMGLVLHQSGHGHSHGLPDHSQGKQKKGGCGGHGGGHGGHGHSHGGHSHASKAENINVTAAFVHVLGDALQSVGVMISAGLIWYNPEWKLADPICTFVFSIIVIFTTVRLVRQSVSVLMEGTPDGIDPEEVENALRGLDGVTDVHDLHIWSLSVGKPSLSVHLLTSDSTTAVLARAKKMVADRFGIFHATMQVERADDEIHCNPAFDRCGNGPVPSSA